MKLKPKIWRGHQFGDGIDGKQVSESTMWGEKFNATVIPDALAFPVEEAMVVCKALEVWYNSSDENMLAKAANKYVNKVAKMREKVKRGG